LSRLQLEILKKLIDFLDQVGVYRNHGRHIDSQATSAVLPIRIVHSRNWGHRGLECVDEIVSFAKKVFRDEYPPRSGVVGVEMGMGSSDGWTS
jgi:hypothetical protein